MILAGRRGKTVIIFKFLITSPKDDVNFSLFSTARYWQFLF